MKIIIDRFEYIRQSLGLPLFYQAAWWDANCGEDNWTPAVIIDYNGEIVAVWPYKISRKLGFKLMLPIPFTPWNGPWILPLKNEKAGIKAVRERKIISELSQLISKEAALIIFRWPPVFQNTQVWKEHGFFQFTHFTRQFKNIDDLKEVRFQFSADLENDLKAAETKLHLAENSDQRADALLKNQRHFLAGKNISFQWDPSIFENIQQGIRKIGGNDLMIEAMDESGRIHGRSWTVMDKHTAWLLIQISEKKYRHRGTTIWLIWQNILALQGKVKTFDLEGSMIPAVSKKYEATGAIQVPLQMLIGGRFAILYIIYQFVIKKIKRK
ncbi:MAG: hypothetical protein ACKOZZ_16310 [Bacteroidota bacterium]